MPISLPEWPPRWPEIEAAVSVCLRSGDWGRYHSQTCQQLRARIEDGFGVSDVRLTCSGTAAIEIGLRAAGIGPGDEVILAAFDYPGNFRTIEILGARPVLVDVAPNSPCIDPYQVESAAGPRTRAVVASHLFGVAAAVDVLRETCDRRGWTLLEDVCQAAGMQIGDKPAGSSGHIAALSFGGSKLLSAGNGGALLTNTARLAARLGPLMDRPSDAFPLSPLQASVLGPQLDRLQELNRTRSRTVRFLKDELMPRLPRWTWESGDTRKDSAYYKVAFSAESSSHRHSILLAAERCGLPMGEGFRSMTGTSDRRSRKPVLAERAERLGQTLFVLDHRVLGLEPQRWQELASCLTEIHDHS